MKPISTFRIAPTLPAKLLPLRDLAYNVYWCWHTEVIELFRRIDRDLWETCGHNPVRLLGEVKQSRFDQLAEDEGFLAQLRRVHEAFTNYLEEQGYVRRGCDEAGVKVAYFSAEFGITECLPIYSGGLGMLAGDHLKSASDLAVPLVGVGLLYQKGYFRQVFNADGWQQEETPENDFYGMPVSECRTADGLPVMVTVELADGPVHAKVWCVAVGRVPLYLLDTNVPENPRQQDRDITDQLYGGEGETRLQQEMVLGIGGVRALAALGLQPTVCHMNEGHAAFLALERIRQAMLAGGLSFDAAREATRCGHVFTTHTPVPAGHDRFALDLTARYFDGYARQLQLTMPQFLDLGRELQPDGQELFSMTVLALHLAAFSNGVSALHGEVSRQMFTSEWPDLPAHEVPIAHVTNGVHSRSWVSGDMRELFDTYLGPQWADDPMDRAVWERVTQIPDEELWRTHERRRERLVAFARRRLRAQLERVGATPREIRTAGEVLDPKVLTIGFARRFATYKRGTLLLRNVERLAAILNSTDRPVQIVYAGKAHPKDNDGKELIRTIIHAAHRDQFRHRIVFLEDYDQQVGRYLVQGCDVWLNTPLRPMEASGTSGMKVIFNGGLNCSIPDGWWPEGYNGSNGWCIGRGEEYGDPDYQNDVESSALYDLLERDIVPLFYERNSEGLPRGWVERMKNSLRTLAPVFNTNRMVLEYTRKFYLPCGLRYRALNEDGSRRAAALATWQQQLRAAWPQVQIVETSQPDERSLQVGDRQQVRAVVQLGPLAPDDVAVQIWHGEVDSHDAFVNGQTVIMQRTGGEGERHVYQGEIACSSSGRHGYTVRVLPKHADLGNPLLLGLVRWA
ncbi:MAG: alpha-glucan family phosphorylase [Fimbriimonadaceae bacterium]|nr:alpha-glucan family phosphorylase [Fimbriimonadaceae bacterium]